METSKTIKGLLAGVVLASGLMVSTPLAPTVVEAATYYDYAGKPLNLNAIEYGTFEEMKAFAAELYASKAYDPGSYLVYTKENYEDALQDYAVFSRDMSEDVPVYSINGRGVTVNVRQVTKGLYETIIGVGEDLSEAELADEKRRIDKAEKYIVDNYKLETEYDVVYAINHFIFTQLDYGKSISADHPFLVSGNNASTCTGYTDLASLLYNRFGIESRVVSGNKPRSAHTWNAVKLGGKWYHSDATYAGSYSKFVTEYVLMTQAERDKNGFTYKTKFRATNDAFDKSKSAAYDYKAVKAAQAKK